MFLRAWSGWAVRWRCGSEGGVEAWSGRVVRIARWIVKGDAYSLRMTDR